MRVMRIKFRQSSRGATTVELAVVSMMFMTLLLAVMEFGRVMFIYNNLVEATRLGARVATVCSVGDEALVKAKMLNMASNIGLAAGNITIAYPAAACSAVSCGAVTVSIGNFNVPLAVPFMNLQFPLPALTTAVPAESLSSANNPLCS